MEEVEYLEEYVEEYPSVIPQILNSSDIEDFLPVNENGEFDLLPVNTNFDEFIAEDPLVKRYCNDFHEDTNANEEMTTNDQKGTLCHIESADSSTHKGSYTNLSKCSNLQNAMASLEPTAKIVSCKTIDTSAIRSSFPFNSAPQTTSIYATRKSNLIQVTKTTKFSGQRKPRSLFGSYTKLNLNRPIDPSLNKIVAVKKVNNVLGGKSKPPVLRGTANIYGSFNEKIMKYKKENPQQFPVKELELPKPIQKITAKPTVRTLFLNKNNRSLNLRENCTMFKPNLNIKKFSKYAMKSMPSFDITSGSIDKNNLTENDDGINNSEIVSEEIVKTNDDSESNDSDKDSFDGLVETLNEYIDDVPHKNQIEENNDFSGKSKLNSTLSQQTIKLDIQPNIIKQGTHYIQLNESSILRKPIKSYGWNKNPLHIESHYEEMGRKLMNSNEKKDKETFKKTEKSDLDSKEIDLREQIKNNIKDLKGMQRKKSDSYKIKITGETKQENESNNDKSIVVSDVKVPPKTGQKSLSSVTKLKQKKSSDVKSSTNQSKFKRTCKSEHFDNNVDNISEEVCEAENTSFGKNNNPKNLNTREILPVKHLSTEKLKTTTEDAKDSGQIFFVQESKALDKVNFISKVKETEKLVSTINEDITCDHETKFTRSKNVKRETITKQKPDLEEENTNNLKSKKNDTETTHCKNIKAKDPLLLFSTSLGSSKRESEKSNSFEAETQIDKSKANLYSDKIKSKSNLRASKDYFDNDKNEFDNILAEIDSVMESIHSDKNKPDKCKENRNVSSKKNSSDREKDANESSVDILSTLMENEKDEENRKRNISLVEQKNSTDTTTANSGNKECTSSKLSLRSKTTQVKSNEISNKELSENIEIINNQTEQSNDENSVGKKRSENDLDILGDQNENNLTNKKEIKTNLENVAPVVALVKLDTNLITTKNSSINSISDKVEFENKDTSFRNRRQSKEQTNLEKYKDVYKAASENIAVIGNEHNEKCISTADNNFTKSENVPKEIGDLLNSYIIKEIELNKEIKTEDSDQSKKDISLMDSFKNTNKKNIEIEMPQKHLEEQSDKVEIISTKRRLSNKSDTVLAVTSKVNRFSRKRLLANSDPETGESKNTLTIERNLKRKRTDKSLKNNSKDEKIRNIPNKKVSHSKAKLTQNINSNKKLQSNLKDSKIEKPEVKSRISVYKRNSLNEEISSNEQIEQKSESKDNCEKDRIDINIDNINAINKNKSSLLNTENPSKKSSKEGNNSISVEGNDKEDKNYLNEQFENESTFLTNLNNTSSSIASEVQNILFNSSQSTTISTVTNLSDLEFFSTYNQSPQLSNKRKRKSDFGVRILASALSDSMIIPKSEKRRVRSTAASATQNESPKKNKSKLNKDVSNPCNSAKIIRRRQSNLIQIRRKEYKKIIKENLLKKQMQSEKERNRSLQRKHGITKCLKVKLKKMSLTFAKRLTKLEKGKDTHQIKKKFEEKNFVKEMKSPQKKDENLINKETPNTSVVELKSLTNIPETILKEKRKVKVKKIEEIKIKPSESIAEESSIKSRMTRAKSVPREIQSLRQSKTKELSSPEKSKKYSTVIPLNDRVSRRDRTQKIDDISRKSKRAKSMPRNNKQWDIEEDSVPNKSSAHSLSHLLHHRDNEDAEGNLLHLKNKIPTPTIQNVDNVTSLTSEKKDLLDNNEISKSHISTSQNRETRRSQKIQSEENVIEKIIKTKVNSSKNNIESDNGLNHSRNKSRNRKNTSKVNNNKSDGNRSTNIEKKEITSNCGSIFISQADRNLESSFSNANNFILSDVQQEVSIPKVLTPLDAKLDSIFAPKIVTLDKLKSKKKSSNSSNQLGKQIQSTIRTGTLQQPSQIRLLPAHIVVESVFMTREEYDQKNLKKKITPVSDSLALKQQFNPKLQSKITTAFVEDSDSAEATTSKTNPCHNRDVDTIICKISDLLENNIKSESNLKINESERKRRKVQRYNNVTQMKFNSENALQVLIFLQNYFFNIPQKTYTKQHIKLQYLPTNAVSSPLAAAPKELSNPFLMTESLEDSEKYFPFKKIRLQKQPNMGKNNISTNLVRNQKPKTSNAATTSKMMRSSTVTATTTSTATATATSDIQQTPTKILRSSEKQIEPNSSDLAQLDILISHDSEEKEPEEILPDLGNVTPPQIKEEDTSDDTIII